MTQPPFPSPTGGPPAGGAGPGPAVPDPTRFVLVEPSHAGNVGAAARAIQVMGFRELVLLNPRWPDVLQREETRAMASGALAVLEQARCVTTWQEAVAGCTWVCATAMTPRDFGPPTEAPRPHLAQVAQRGHRLALVFGPERTGLSNADVYRCHACLSIPTDPGYGSLNLAQAVQLLAYEWRQALGGFGGPAAAPTAPVRWADAAEVEGLLAHWQRTLVDIGYLDPATPRKLMPRLQQLAHRLQLTPPEVHVLRGIARAAAEAATRRPAGDGALPPD